MTVTTDQRLPTDEAPRQSRAQEVAAALETRIQEADLAVGARVGLRSELIETYGVSPTVMSEALGILRERHVIDVRRGPNGGVFVAAAAPHVRLGVVHLWFHHTNVSPAWMFELRVRVENRAVPHVLAGITEGDLATLQVYCDTIAHTQNAAEYLEAAYGFHDVLVQAAGDDLLAEMHRMLLTVLRVSLSRATFSPDADLHRPRTVTIHRELIDALRSKDGDRYEEWTRAHFHTLMRAGVDVDSAVPGLGQPVWANLPAPEHFPGGLGGPEGSAPS